MALVTKIDKVYCELTDTFIDVGVAHQSKTDSVTIRTKSGGKQQSITMPAEVWKLATEWAWECRVQNGIDD